MRSWSTESELLDVQVDHPVMGVDRLTRNGADVVKSVDFRPLIVEPGSTPCHRPSRARSWPTYLNPSRRPHDHTITAADPIPDDVQAALDAI
jgi:hypothetical protein